MALVLPRPSVRRSVSVWFALQSSGDEYILCLWQTCLSIWMTKCNWDIDILGSLPNRIELQGSKMRTPCWTGQCTRIHRQLHGSTLSPQSTQPHIRKITETSIQLFLHHFNGVRSQEGTRKFWTNRPCMNDDEHDASRQQRRINIAHWCRVANHMQRRLSETQQRLQTNVAQYFATNRAHVPTEEYPQRHWWWMHVADNVIYQTS